MVNTEKGIEYSRQKYRNIACPNFGIGLKYLAQMHKLNA